MTPSSQSATPRWWTLNTDQRHGAVDAPSKWLERGIAVVSSSKALTSFKTLEIGDMALMWVSRSGRASNGLSAIGRVTSEVFDVTNRSDMVNPAEAWESHRLVDWFVDMRDAPIQRGALTELGIVFTRLSNITIGEVLHPQPLIDLAVDRLGAPTPSAAECDRRALAIRALGASRSAKPIGTRRPSAVAATTLIYPRCPKVRAWTLDRAAGHCECCGQAAPFVDLESTPFLESHHIVWLSRGGDDVTSNTVALCPNCHRELHHGIRREALQAILAERIPLKDLAYESARLRQTLTPRAEGRG